MLSTLIPLKSFLQNLKRYYAIAAKRTVDALWDHIGRLLDSFSPEECRNYFASSGYVNN